MTHNDAWFKLGAKVVMTLDVDASLIRPSKAELKGVAVKLGISQADCDRALSYWNHSSSQDAPAKAAPIVFVS